MIFFAYYLCQWIRPLLHLQRAQGTRVGAYQAEFLFVPATLFASPPLLHMCVAAPQFASRLLIHLHQKHKQLMWNCPRNFVARLETLGDGRSDNAMQRRRLFGSMFYSVAALTLS